MDFRVTTLVDNSVSLGGGKLIGEHGLSLYVETGDHKIVKNAIILRFRAAPQIFYQSTSNIYP
jgi:hypothetical protein